MKSTKPKQLRWKIKFEENINNLRCHIGLWTARIKCNGGNEFTAHLLYKPRKFYGDSSQQALTGRLISLKHGKKIVPKYKICASMVSLSLLSLGIDRNILHKGAINKDRVTHEYYTRLRKIGQLELSSYNKTISHSACAQPMIIPTFGILDWFVEEIHPVCIKTGKTSISTENLHRDRDIDRIYLGRDKGDGSLDSVQTAFECRIISLRQHLLNDSNKNMYINLTH